MDFRDSVEEAAFRDRLRGWLTEQKGKFPTSGDAYWAKAGDWHRALYAAGFFGTSWPKQYGGQGLPPVYDVIVDEEIAKAGAPARPSLGYLVVGFSAHAGEEIRERFLPGMINGSERWCQGFSEPDSGSDLASLKTTAVQDGDEWVINGQKVWTTQAQFADYCFVLARTDPDVKKQAGISYLLVPMDQPGIEVRGIVQPDGTAEFNEVFFTDARCPIDNVVGGVNNGWKVANDTLGFERGMSATTGHRRFEEEYRRMVAMARERGVIDDPTVRQGLMRYYTKIQILRINGLRSLTQTLNKTKDMGVVSLGLTNKMFWSEMHRDAMELALDIFGPASMLIDTAPPSGSWPAVMRAKGRDTYKPSPMMSAFFFSRSETIWGGTAEIQRNIVGEKFLGLPREPKAPAASS
ncbi:MAG: acyl-CoA dehydrogenase family protein [Actinobacteria bacterium]|nr:acyl-CoA dehydrogenase family protein [Actinomycetota bacterium]